MPVREQQEEERDGQHHDRDPARRIERDQHEAGSRIARVEQVFADRYEERRQPEERPDPEHQPPDRVLRAAGRQHVPDHREHREREDEADVPERVAGAGRTDGRRQERVHEPDREADQREAGQDAGEQDAAARTTDGLSRCLGGHEGMLASERGPAKGPTLPVGGVRASPAAGRPPHRPVARSRRWRIVGWWMKG